MPNEGEEGLCSLPSETCVEAFIEGGTQHCFMNTVNSSRLIYAEMSGTTCRIEEIVVVGGQCVFCVFHVE
jgi:hypothetical protein